MYIRAQKAVEAIVLEGDEQLGIQIVCRSLEEPLRIIAANHAVKEKARGIQAGMTCMGYGNSVIAINKFNQV